MDFALPLIESESTASRSNIRYLHPVTVETASGTTLEERQANIDLDNQVIDAANLVAYELFHGSASLPPPIPNTTATATATQDITSDSPFLPDEGIKGIIKNGTLKRFDPKMGHLLDSSKYKYRLIPSHPTIRPGDLVVIQESFDTLDFVYVQPNSIYQNRNGNFHHNDFIDKPFGSKIRSRDLRGYGFIYLLKPTPELWTRSLNHRTQVVHELDQSQIIFQLYIQPNDIVVESGTGSGAMSHALIRTIAPHGHVHTYEFNQHRAETARAEFQQHGLQHLVTVHHKDVCRGLVEVDSTATHDEKNIGDEKQTNGAGSNGQEVKPGFDLPGQSVNAVFLDLPEPWLAVPHAAYILKPNGRIASYSPCVEQTQKTVAALEKAGFHSMKTMEYRLQEHYVDEYEFVPPPFEKLTRPEPHNTSIYNENNGETNDGDEAPPPTIPSIIPPKDSVTSEPHQTVNDEKNDSNNNDNAESRTRKRNRTILVARPFVTMRGHTAFLTFATAGLVLQPNPN